ncbi:hypothetical protein LOZ12_002240 [Ophidiomyces ophidiicola]|uniref:Uncharacterized protein n=1 Tax=Ophidiomyces ophidiicola TaxID=1387563 RepID=A0ACB8UYU5_9EURO|nr:hypothetical protein LOZ64_002061 [Ophidiomyces ophidiicola]KAI1950059.1 hypothetical protein LOZ62_002042 [Ophidiomyces ophidiicola]KAI1959456.1 hypothetical protein LOZ59_003059 [Ophidiomyces ophidiicola]KAI1973795.1 hypothetical protein LOZ56_001651 [Ophidiomyces ophidiicola]KAI2032264.1 hypothetical protein LOZ45_001135 [Ophidiomyces ophidiicola]
MATLSATGLQPTTASKDLVVELIWQHAVNHLKKTKNEIFLPVDISSLIGGDNIEKIKSRLSAMLNVPVVAFEDHANNIYRIMPTPALDGAIESTVAQLLPMMAAGEYGIQNLGERSSKQNVQPKSAKVPRPPNAFILYRQHHHPLIKAAHPEYHNNDISILLGKKWKSETAEVKAHFKTLADEIKRKHAEDHPDYQYAPRKPSEKKRRSASRRDGYFSAIKNTQVNHPPFSGTFASNSTPNCNGVDSSRDTSMPLENNDGPKTPPTVIESDFDPLMMDRSASFVVGVDEGGFLTFHRRRRAPVSTSTTSSPSATTTATQATSNSLSGGSNPTEWNALDFDFDEYFAGTE